MAEWLRRWTANPMCSAREGSNPFLVGNFFATGYCACASADYIRDAVPVPGHVACESSSMLCSFSETFHVARGALAASLRISPAHVEGMGGRDVELITHLDHS